MCQLINRLSTWIGVTENTYFIQFDHNFAHQNHFQHAISLDLASLIELTTAKSVLVNNDYNTKCKLIWIFNCVLNSVLISSKNMNLHEYLMYQEIWFHNTKNGHILKWSQKKEKEKTKTTNWIEHFAIIIVITIITWGHDSIYANIMDKMGNFRSKNHPNTLNYSNMVE